MNEEKNEYFRVLVEAAERARTNDNVCNVMLIVIEQREDPKTGKIRRRRALRHNYEDTTLLLEDMVGVGRNVLTEGLSNAPEGEF